MGVCLLYFIIVVQIVPAVANNFVECWSASIALSYVLTLLRFVLLNPFSFVNWVGTKLAQIWCAFYSYKDLYLFMYICQILNGSKCAHRSLPK